MLLRWLVNQYLREAGEGKVREVVTELTRTVSSRIPESPPPEVSDRETRSLNPEPRTPNPVSAADDFIPCDAAFLFALGIESGGLVDLLQGAETSRLPHAVERAGKLAGREVVIVESGVGQKAAAKAATEAIKFYKPSWVVSAGFAGGLTDDLRRGHIIMADQVVNAAGQRLSTGLPIDRERAAETKGLHIGRLLCVDSILRDPAERRGLAAQHQAIACDMETFAIADVCQKQAVRCLAIRVISDAVDDELPPEIEHLLKQNSLAGKLGAAAGAVFKRFSAAKDLWKLREDALKASDRLAKFLEGVVRQLP